MKTTEIEFKLGTLSDAERAPLSSLLTEIGAVKDAWQSDVRQRLEWLEKCVAARRDLVAAQEHARETADRADFAEVVAIERQCAVLEERVQLSTRAEQRHTRRICDVLRRGATSLRPYADRCGEEVIDAWVAALPPIFRSAEEARAAVMNAPAVDDFRRWLAVMLLAESAQDLRELEVDGEGVPQIVIASLDTHAQLCAALLEGRALHTWKPPQPMSEAEREQRRELKERLDTQSQSQSARRGG